MQAIKQLTLLLLLVPSLLYGQQRTIEYVEYTLDNGLHVILHQDNSAPIVAVSTMYHVGSKDEVPGRTGFAHFFEHVASRGTKNIPVGEFTKYVENAGGRRNANTTFDRTYYYEILPSNQLKLGLWLASERLLHMTIDSVVVETQREVVKEEKRLRYDNRPYGTVFQEMLKRAYKVHPYQWTVIGSMEDLDAATIESFTDFNKRFYVPNNAVLSIAGDLDIEETRQLIDAYFSGIPGGAPIERNYPEEPALEAEIIDTVYDNIQLPAVIYGYHMPAEGTDDYYALSMLNRVLSGGASSRLPKSIRDEQSLALSVSSFLVSNEEPGLFMLFGVVKNEVPLTDLQDAIDAEIEKVKAEGITDREFQKIRNQVENDFVSSNSSMAGIAESLANYHMYYGDAGLINTEIERYMAVTPEQIQAVAEKYLKQDSRVILHFLPKAN